jgi:type IV fimbrial biogenesis protein FimT
MRGKTQIIGRRGIYLNTQNGFSLIELMFAIGLSAMLVGMGAPAMSHLIANSRQTGAINDLVSSMHKARSAAVMTNTRVTMCTSDDGSNCETSSWHDGWIVFSDRDSDQSVDLNETIIASSNDMKGLDIKSGQFGQFLMYRPNGRVMNSSINGNLGEFTFCDSRGSTYAKVLIIDLSGRPRSSRKLANGSSPVCT